MLKKNKIKLVIFVSLLKYLMKCIKIALKIYILVICLYPKPDHKINIMTLRRKKRVVFSVLSYFHPELELLIKQYFETQKGWKRYVNQPQFDSPAPMFYIIYLIKR